MGELVFIGLGLDDEKGITLRGLDETRSADVVFAEGYTSALPGGSLEAILANRTAGLHTLVLLDLREDGTFLAPRDAVGSLLRMASAIGTTEFGPHTLACVLSRVGSPEVRAFAGPIAKLADRDLGPPPHCLVFPGTLHFLEKEALVAFAGAPHDL